MKKLIPICFLLLSFVIVQGCSSKEEEVAEKQKTEAAAQKALDEKQAQEVTAKREALVKARAEKEEQRKIARLEKMKLAPTFKDASGRIVYYQVEVQPSYTGGEDEMNKYLQDNLKYPADAEEKGHEGTVFVDFVIDSKGQIREVVASDVVGENIDEDFKTESIRVVSAMPGWKAGLQNGKAVDASFSLPITFRMN